MQEKFAMQSTVHSAVQVSFSVNHMVLMLDGNSEHAAHAWRKRGLSGEKNPICDYSEYDQLHQIQRLLLRAQLILSYHLI